MVPQIWDFYGSVAKFTSTFDSSQVLFVGHVGDLCLPDISKNLGKDVAESNV
jgi:hypothetical protein